MKMRLFAAIFMAFVEWSGMQRNIGSTFAGFLTKPQDHESTKIPINPTIERN
jgi:hypothetical protein